MNNFFKGLALFCKLCRNFKEIENRKKKIKKHNKDEKIKRTKKPFHLGRGPVVENAH
jgi:hypothetical protein